MKEVCDILSLRRPEPVEGSKGGALSLPKGGVLSLPKGGVLSLPKGCFFSI